MTEWYIIASIIGLVIGIGIISAKIMKKDELSLDDRIGGVKGFWDKCCAKVKGMVGV